MRFSANVQIICTAFFKTQYHSNDLEYVLSASLILTVRENIPKTGEKKDQERFRKVHQ